MMLVACAPASAAKLQAGVGRSDVTPPTGFATMGYVRSRRRSRRGQHTRLFARAIVLREGGTQARARHLRPRLRARRPARRGRRRLASRGFSRAQRDHLGVAHPLGAGRLRELPAPTTSWRPRRARRRASRSRATRSSTASWSSGSRAAIARADDDLGPARAGWGDSEACSGVTANRSLEAHLADHGIDLPYGTGKVARTRGGYAAHDRPGGRRAARGPGRAAAARSRWAPGRRSPTTAPSTRTSSASTTPTTTARPSRIFERDRAAGRPRAGARRTW